MVAWEQKEVAAKEVFDDTVPVTGSGYEGLVAAQSQLVANLSREIADAIKGLE